MDVTENVGPGVIGYCPDEGILIRGERVGDGPRFVPVGPGECVEVVMADPVDQRVFGVGTDDPVVIVRPWLSPDGTVRRYLARHSWFEFRRGGQGPQRRRPA